MKNNLRAIREEKGITQRKLAEMTGLSKATICYLDKNKRFFSGDSLRRIAAALKCREEDIFVSNAVPPIQAEEKGGKEKANEGIIMKLAVDNPYPFKEEYLKHAMAIIDDIIDHDLYHKDEKAHLLHEVYKMVFDFYENGGEEQFQKEMQIKALASQGVLKFLNMRNG